MDKDTATVAAVIFTKVVVLMSDNWAREGDSNGPNGSDWVSCDGRRVGFPEIEALNARHMQLGFPDIQA